MSLSKTFNHLLLWLLRDSMCLNLSFIIIDLEIFIFYFYQAINSLLPFPKRFPLIWVSDLTSLIKVHNSKLHGLLPLPFNSRNKYLRSIVAMSRHCAGNRYSAVNKIGEIWSLSSV